MYFFRTFKKSTAPYKLHNMGLRYINNLSARPVLTMLLMGCGGCGRGGPRSGLPRTGDWLHV
jgi:hypothetical protein